MKYLIAGGLLACAIAGCAPEVSNLSVCTAIFAYVSVTVVDSNGVALTGPFAVSDTVERTAAVLDVVQQGYPVGTATVFSDNYTAEVLAEGEPVRVTGTGEGGTFHAIYQLGNDGCHIKKVAGPDTVVAR